MSIRFGRSTGEFGSIRSVDAVAFFSVALTDSVMEDRAFISGGFGSGEVVTGRFT